MPTKQIIIEHRNIPAELRIETRAADEKQIITGYAAVFESLSEIIWGFREKIARGAFAESLAENDEVHALYNHDSGKVLGRRGSGTLKVWEDDYGLAIEIDPPNTTDGNDVVELLSRGDLVSMSFGFIALSDSWALDDGVDIRTVEKAKLFDVSIVTSPAYPATTVGLREGAECGEVALRSLEAHRAAIAPPSPDSNTELFKMNCRLRIAEAG